MKRETSQHFRLCWIFGNEEKCNYKNTKQRTKNGKNRNREKERELKYSFRVIGITMSWLLSQVREIWNLCIVHRGWEAKHKFLVWAVFSIGFYFLFFVIAKINSSTFLSFVPLFRFIQSPLFCYYSVSYHYDNMSLCHACFYALKNCVSFGVQAHKQSKHRHTKVNDKQTNKKKIMLEKSEKKKKNFSATSITD